MSKAVTVSILLFLIFFADLLSIQQTLNFWQKNNFAGDEFSIVFILIAQTLVAVALLACAGFIFYKSFSEKN